MSGLARCCRKSPATGGNSDGRQQINRLDGCRLGPESVRSGAETGRRRGEKPGGIVIDGKNRHFYFLVMTCVVMSILLSLIMWLLQALTLWPTGWTIVAM